MPLNRHFSPFFTYPTVKNGIIVYFFLFYNFYAIIRTGETMRSIKETTTNTIIIKKSEFITTLIPCNDEKKIKDSGL